MKKKKDDWADSVAKKEFKKSRDIWIDKEGKLVIRGSSSKELMTLIDILRANAGLLDYHQKRINVTIAANSFVWKEVSEIIADMIKDGGLKGSFEEGRIEVNFMTSTLWVRGFKK